MSLQFAQASGLFAAASKTTSNGSGSVTFLIVLMLIVGVYYFYMRPRQLRMRAGQAADRAASSNISAGDTVVTASGIIGRVLSIEGDRASVEIAPDTVVEIHRSALGKRVEQTIPDENDRWESLPDADAPTEIVDDAPPAGDDDGHTTPGEDHPGGAQ